ncbi:MAG: ABC transporter ATP-binding protein [Kiritimatiellae bacterium]|nr:ABC transporter ATP-binding protein [Kiritimatiellia bacterium]
MNEAIVTRNLVKRYGRHRALDGFTLGVPAYSITGLVGRNGAGKTTWMMSVAGFVMPTSGEISLLSSGPFDASRHSGRFAILPQDSELPLTACPRELLVRYARLQGIAPGAAAREADSLLETFNLSDKAARPVRSLSHGMRKRVMVAQAFLGSPDVIMLDEPLSGLDPVEADRMRAFIRSYRGRSTIVISSHQLDDIQKLCTHVAFVDAGKVERIDTLSSITSQSGRVVYSLRRGPSDLPSLESLMPGLRLSWNAGDSSLTAEFDSAVAPEDLNAKLLPRLLDCGVVSIASGRTLEQAYLDR